MQKNNLAMKILRNLVWINLIVGLMFWGIDSVADSLLFEEKTIFEEMFFPEAREIWIRCFILFALLVQGFGVQMIIDRKCKLTNSMIEDTDKTEEKPVEINS